MSNSIEDQKQRVLKAKEVINYLNTLEPSKNVKIQLNKAAAILTEDVGYLNFLENSAAEINNDELETK